MRDRRIGEFLDKIYQRYPEARSHNPGGVGVMFVVMERSRLHFHYHLLIDDEELRLEALALIATLGLPIAAEPDGVLVLASAV
jgi:hypothetical protein